MVQNFRVDLQTKIITKETRVFLARAGKHGHMFRQVIESKAIGPDLPNLDLDLTDGLRHDDNLEAKVKRSRALSAWLRKPVSQRGQEPSKNLNDYTQARKGKGYGQVEGIVSNYFENLRAGDVLVIPNPSYFDDAAIAEVLPASKYSKKILGAGRFEGYDFDGRQIDHLVKVKMAALPRSVIDLAKAPTGFAQILDPAVKRRIFDLTYSEYVFDDEFAAKITVTKKDFTPFDANVLNAFVTMVAINLERLESDGEDAHLVGLVQAAFLNVSDDDLHVRININSPGHIAVVDRSIVPLVTAALLSILIAAGFDSSAIAQDATIAVTNSKVEQALDLCSKDVQRITQSMLRFLAEAEFQETCALLKKTHESTGAKSAVIVK